MFKSLDSVKVNQDWNVSLPKETIQKLPELAVYSKFSVVKMVSKINSFDLLQVNPLRDRIVKVFSSKKDDTLSFEDFLNMMSVFSEAAPVSVKCCYAFEIYGMHTDILNEHAFYNHQSKRIVFSSVGKRSGPKKKKPA
jgi:hypothetical protein